MIAGDWNIQPAELMASDWVDIVRGLIVVPELPACHESVYDYSVLSSSLQHAVRGVQRVEDAGLVPRTLTRLLLIGDARRPAIRQLVKPSSVTAQIPYGPPAQPPVYVCVGTDDVDEFIETAMRKWYTTARDGWSALIGRPVPAKPHQIVWRSAAGNLAKPFIGASYASNLWRALPSAMVCAGEVSRRIC